jgi:RNA polymerase I-specific transcription initiation factor RRN6
MLDAKRSPEHYNHLFILTTSRIFWLEIVPPGEHGGDVNTPASIKVILSFRHFRDTNDETLRLTLVNDELGMAAIETSRLS